MSYGSTKYVQVDDRSKDETFLSWLRANGAVFDSIVWPSYRSDGNGNSRGAVAREDIAPGEYMIVIPCRLMMSEVHAQSDSDLGHVYRENAAFLKSDNSLALYIMQEILKGESSFYWPYLSILPQPNNIRHWSQRRLDDLQDEKLVRRSASQARQLHALYDRTMQLLESRYPGLFPPDKYTYELFDFAWGTIQARAFGKRLSCSALVPLADCLNHGNVQTKYDFDVDCSEVFRLFPSGTNHYPAGAEVLNSYGRRPNHNLLLEYGFAIIDNRWDEVELRCSVSPFLPNFARIKNYMRSLGQYTTRGFRLVRDHWAMDLVRFHRCSSLTTEELERIHDQSTCLSDMSAETRNSENNDGTAGDGARGHMRTDVKMCSKQQECSKFPSTPLSIKNELSALTEVSLQLLDGIGAYPTTLEHDERVLEAGRLESAEPELLSALAYRITTKRILEQHLKMIEEAMAFVQAIGARHEDSCEHVVPSHAPASGGKLHFKAGDAHKLSSFEVYLESVEKALFPVPRGGTVTLRQAQENTVEVKPCSEGSRQRCGREDVLREVGMQRGE